MRNCILTRLQKKKKNSNEMSSTNEVENCPHINATSCRPPKATDRVYKEECVQCFKTWEDPEGIFVCLSCYNGGCFHHAQMHSKKRGHTIALNIKRMLKPQTVMDLLTKSSSTSL